MYLQLVLQEDEESLLFKFLNAQMDEPKKGDWWLKVKKDIEQLNLNLSLHEIKSMSKASFKNLVQTAVKAESFQWLSIKKCKSKKVKNIPHDWFEIQKYLSQPIMSTKETKFLFGLSSRMIHLRENYPGMQAENHCPLCSSSSGVENFMDSQEHLLVCSKLQGESEVMEDNLEHNAQQFRLIFQRVLFLFYPKLENLVKRSLYLLQIPFV